ncbi:MAG: Holliday junction branch migration protein RuvA, partial [Myxococcaceae bacterium]
LKDKVKGVALTPREEAAKAPVVRSDLVSALVNLGYKEVQAERSADAAAARLGPDAALELLFREALKGLRSGT